eukprot:6001810-Pleurochrysis_carterae.AAC.2
MPRRGRSTQRAGEGRCNEPKSKSAYKSGCEGGAPRWDPAREEVTQLRVELRAKSTRGEQAEVASCGSLTLSDTGVDARA